VLLIKPDSAFGWLAALCRSEAPSETPPEMMEISPLVLWQLFARGSVGSIHKALRNIVLPAIYCTSSMAAVQLRLVSGHAFNIIKV